MEGGREGGVLFNRRRTCRGEMVCVLVPIRAFLDGVLLRKRGLVVF